MNLRFVEAFHWAVALKSVTRAAEKLHITQSALSSRIAALERELGVLLLDRRDKQFRLTVAGQRFHAFAQKLLEMQMHIKAEMGSGAVREAVLRVGAIESVVHSWLTGWLKHMQATYPDFELELTVETTPVLVDQLQRGKQDLVFAALPAAGDGVRTRAVPPMPMCFVGHRELHLKRRYRLPDLLSLDLLTFQRGSQPHVALLELFRDAGSPPPRVHAISSISAMAQLVEAGFGVATLPRAVVEPLARRLPLRVLPCDDTLEPLPIYASYRDDPSSPLPEAALGSAVVHASHRPGSSKKSMS
jgi:DNA-binding transcriptional LysR family regulator